MMELYVLLQGMKAKWLFCLSLYTTLRKVSLSNLVNYNMNTVLNLSIAI